MIKLVLLFLLVMVGLALFGRFRLPPRKPMPPARPCPRCGRPKIGPGPCPCTNGTDQP